MIISQVLSAPPPRGVLVKIRQNSSAFSLLFLNRNQILNDDQINPNLETNPAKMGRIIFIAIPPPPLFGFGGVF